MFKGSGSGESPGHRLSGLGAIEVSTQDEQDEVWFPAACGRVAVQIFPSQRPSSVVSAGGEIAPRNTESEASGGQGNRSRRKNSLLGKAEQAASA